MTISTRKGNIQFPAYIPVTTFGEKYPLDNLIRPYLPRLASAVMVSYHYAKQATKNQLPNLPLLVDSGGFVSLFDEAIVRPKGELGVIEFNNEIIHPRDVLELQEQIADVAFTLDFPSLGIEDAQQRQQLTIKNALWALNNKRRRDLPLYACVQGWDIDSYTECAASYCDRGFDGIAIGGLVPRIKDLDLVLGIVRGVKSKIGKLPLHVFGIGHPDIVPKLYENGVDSVDSSSYVKYAASGKLWCDASHEIIDPTPTDRLHLALCNLAVATGKALPLSASKIVYSTFR